MAYIKADALNELRDRESVVAFGVNGDPIKRIVMDKPIINERASGERVIIDDVTSSFHGFKALFGRHVDSERVQVFLTLIGKSTSVVVSASSVKSRSGRVVA